MEQEKINEFWSWFQANEHKYFELNPDNANVLINRMSNRLKHVQKGLSVHFSGGLTEDGKKELVMSADGKKELFPAVFEIIKHAPDLPNWLFTALKPRVPSLGQSFAIRLHDQKLSLEDIWFTAVPNEEKLDVTFFYPKRLDISEPVLEGTFHLLDYLIGEYDVETKIGGMDFQPLAAKSSTMKPLIELPKEIDRLVH